MISVIIHELGHLYGVDDHYDATVGPNDSLGRSDNCIWGINKDDPNVNSNYTMCSYCTSVLKEHCGNFNHN